MTALILDAGAFIAHGAGSRDVVVTIQNAQLDRVPLRTSAAVVAQVWRDGTRQVGLLRLLRGVTVVPLDHRGARGVGILLRRDRSSDIVDAHVARLVGDGDTLMTSDPDDLRRLLETRGVAANLVRV